MKKYFLLLTITTIASSIFACPWEFSPQDQRPFFEQYENGTTTPPIDNKEKKS